MVARPLEFLSMFKLRPPPLEVLWKHQNSFPDEAGNGPSSRDEEGIPGLFWSLAEPLVFLLKGDEYVGELLSCLKGVKEFFVAQEGRGDFF